MKNKYSKILVLLTVIVLVLSFVSAEASNKEDNKAKLERNKANEPLDKITFIHYKDGTVKEMGRAASGNQYGNQNKLAVCYKLLGVKWNLLPVSYVIGSTDSFVISAISTATTTWDKATSKNLFTIYTTDPLAMWDDGITNPVDYKNEYVFGSYSNNNVIAVTVIWYTRYGMQIVDYDVLFNTYYTWKDCSIETCSVDTRDMDLQNIATHETGHGIGLADLYTSTCSAVTMYGYASVGELIKRTLEKADITGLQKMYGI